MNRYFSILLHSILLVGASLSLGSVSLPEQTTTTQPAVSSPSELLAFGSGIPESRGSGGTR